MAGFPFMRQAEAFLSSLPFILLLAVFILPCPMSAAAKPRPAIAFVHLLLPPGGEPHASPAGWIGSLDRARDTLESLRIPTIVSSASPGNAEDLNELSEMDPEVLITTSPLLYAAACDVAKRSPNTVFFACTDETVHDNMSGFQARTYEAHYLAGLIAGALSEDGVIGYLANDPYQSKASRLRNANAFTLGAQKSKAAIRVLYAPGNDPDEELKTLIAAGADIVDLERALPSLVERLREHSVRYVGTAAGSTSRQLIESSSPSALFTSSKQCLRRSAHAGTFRHLEAEQRLLRHQRRRRGAFPLRPGRTRNRAGSCPRGEGGHP